MLEYEDELRSINEIIDNPEENDQITTKRWINNKTFIDGLMFINNNWYRIWKNKKELKFSGKLTKEGYLTNNSSKKEKWIIPHKSLLT